MAAVIIMAAKDETRRVSIKSEKSVKEVGFNKHFH